MRLGVGTRRSRRPQAGPNSEGTAPPSGFDAPPQSLGSTLAVLAFAAIGFGALIVMASPSQAQSDEPGEESTEVDCLGCHDRDRLIVELPSGEVLDATVDSAEYHGSAHGAAGVSCTSCHQGIEDYPHPPVTATDAREFTLVANQVCTNCHGTKTGGDDDVHATALAAGDPDAPVCTSCHGVHDIVRAPDPTQRSAMCSTCHTPEFPVSGVHQPDSHDGVTGVACSDCHGSHLVGAVETLVPSACTDCHRSEVDAYDEGVHEAALVGGDTAGATCTNCHGPAHTAVSSEDPEAPTNPLNLPATCGACHGDPDFAAQHDLPNVFDQYIDSIHGRAVLEDQLLIAANCSTCHGSHAIRAPDDPESRVYPTNIASTCGTCHDEVETEYLQSVHGTEVAAGDLEAAVCTDCHTAHEIIDVDTVEWKLEVVRECGTCHEESLTTYRDTFHGQVTSLGYTRVARCSDCHEYHTIQRVEDPRSAVSSERIVSTCQKCHPAAGERFAQFSPHADASNPADGGALHFTQMFMTVLIVGVLGFFGVHSVLWGVRAGIDEGVPPFGRFRRRRDKAGTTGDDTDPEEP